MANIQKRGNQPEILKKEAVNPDHLPPQRPSKSVSKQVSPPLSGVSLTTFIYALVALSLAYLLFQSANIASWSLFGAKSTSASARAASGAADAAKDKLYASAKSKAASATSGSGAKASGVPGDLTVEDRIRDLADALGMPSGDLARAIAVAVREYVPPASLSSVSAAAQKTGGASEIVDELLGDGAHADASSSSSSAAAAATGGGGVSGIIGKVVGMDEPPAEQV